MISALLALLFSVSAWAEIQTNAVSIASAPKWVTAARVNRVVDRVERFLEWDIRKIRVKWFDAEYAFSEAHHLGAGVLAVARKEENAVWIGPKVTSENFDVVFGHELGHVILFQKYKEAIPKWLEEGLVNFAAKGGRVDYGYLIEKPAIDVRTMSHPFKSAGNGEVDPKYHYMASTGLIEMIASRCNIYQLLQLSTGKNLDNYLPTFCGIKDLNEEFQKWVKRHAPASSAPAAAKP